MLPTSMQAARIGVLVDVETDVVNDAVKEMAKNVAMQIAALNPQYTSRDEVSADYIEHEKEHPDGSDPERSEGSFQKPEKVIQGMIQGRINKEMKEICLLRPGLRKGRGRKAVRSSVRSSGCKRERCKHHC